MHTSNNTRHQSLSGTLPGSLNSPEFDSKLLKGQDWILQGRTKASHTMCHLKLSAVFLALSLVLLCVTATPGNRYVTSSGEQAESRLGRKGWFPAEFSRNRFLRSGGSLPQAGVTSHHIAKRRCNTSTCITQRLADFLVRSSNNVGPIYTHTNVGSNTYGKRDSLQPGNSENL